MGAVFQLCHFKSKKPKRHLTACCHESYRPLKNRLPDSSVWASTALNRILERSFARPSFREQNPRNRRARIFYVALLLAHYTGIWGMNPLLADAAELLGRLCLAVRADLGSETAAGLHDPSVVSKPPWATSRQIRAFRKNAKHSTGPRTSEGKARSSQNARKHGLFARDTVLPDENPEEFLQLIAALEEELAAATDFERRLVHHIAATEWRMRRLIRLETGSLTHQLNQERLCAQRAQAALPNLNQSMKPSPDGQNGAVQAEPGNDSAPPPVDPYQQTTNELGTAVMAYCEAPVLLTLSLYESRLTRKYLSLLKQLRLTQKLRRAETVAAAESVAADETVAADESVVAAETVAAGEGMEPAMLPAETEVRPPPAESQQQQPPPAATARLNPQPPVSESARANHLPTPASARPGP